MAVVVKHQFESLKADGPDATQVKPSDWNADHDILTESASVVLGQDESGPGSVKELPIAVTSDGDVTFTAALGYFLGASGTEAQRPSHVGGRMRWNTDALIFEYSDGGTWQVLANIEFVAAIVGSATARAAVRQTVANGPRTAGGLPDLLPSTSASLDLTGQNVTATKCLVIASAGGYDPSTGNPQDTISIDLGDPVWTALTDNTTCYLYAICSQGSVPVYDHTTLAPIYQLGGTPSITNGQITFNIGDMRGYLGDGATANETPIVVVGEAVTLAGVVTSTICYAYNGEYDSGYTATLPVSTTTDFDHNIGQQPDKIWWDILLACTTNDAGYTVGQVVRSASFRTDDGTSAVPLMVVSSKNTSTWKTNSNHDIGNFSTGFLVALTPASWKYKFIANRGW